MTHDPLERAADGEPHFLLLARDWRAPYFARLYGAIRDRNWTAAKQIFANLMETAPTHDGNFDKDRAHAREASAVAIAMELYLMEKRG